MTEHDPVLQPILEPSIFLQQEPGLSLTTALGEARAQQILRRLRPECWHKLTEASQRLQDAFNNSLLDDTSHGVDILQVTHLMPAQMAVVLEVAKRHTPEMAWSLIRSPKQIAGFQEDTKREAAFLFLDTTRDVSLTGKLLASPKAVERYATHPEILTHRQQQLEELGVHQRLRPFEVVCVYEADDTIVDVLIAYRDKPWLVDYMVSERLGDLLREPIGDVTTRCRFIDAYVPAEVVTAAQKNNRLPAAKLLSGRVTFLQALENVAKGDDLKDLFGSPEAIAMYAEVQSAARLQHDANLAHRQKEVAAGRVKDVAIDAEYDPVFGEEVRSIIQECGLLPLALRSVSQVTVTNKDKLGGTTGLYQNFNNSLTVARPETVHKKNFIATVVHELGHAFKRLMGNFPEQQGLMDQYAMQLMTGGRHFASTYAEAVRLRSGQASDRYLNEAFAEDLRLLFHDRSKLPEKRGTLLIAMLRNCLPELDVQQVFEQTQRTIGQRYGWRMNDIRETYSCDDAISLARYLERVKSE